MQALRRQGWEKWSSTKGVKRWMERERNVGLRRVNGNPVSMYSQPVDIPPWSKSLWEFN